MQEGSGKSPHPPSTLRSRTRQPDTRQPDLSSSSRELLDAVVECLKAYAHHLLHSVQIRGEELLRQIQASVDTLIDAVAHGSAGMRAGLEGIRAAAAGKNPVLAAIKGLISGLSGPAKVGLVLLVVLGLLLGPVLLVVLLLILVVAALVAVVRAAAG